MRKYHYYVDPDTHALNLADAALSVHGDARVETLVFIFPENFDIDTTSSVLRVYYDLPGHKGPSLFETLNQAVAGAGGVRLAEWMVDKIHTDTPGRLSFSLAVIADEGVRWISRKTWIPVADSHYRSDSQGQEEGYASRLETAEAAIAAMQAGKQDVLTFDAAPTEGSSNPVTSGGAFMAIKESRGMVSTTWAELKALRDDGQLIPGQAYRITDYVCTTTQEDSRVESHPYDIIVTADSETALGEIARACVHDAESAGYYQHAHIEAWELKYSLDNDKSRFAWADEQNGHGVVYYLKDEHGNECPYDFKQIQFARYKITACKKVPSLVGKYAAAQHGDAITGIDEENPVWCFTFSHDPESTGVMSDASVMEFNASADVSGNIVKTFYSYQDSDMGLQIAALNCIVILGNVCQFNTFGNNSYFNTFGNNCLSNTFGDNFLTNTFGDRCQCNTFGDSCHSNTSGNGYSSNVFGNFCASNTFGDSCSSNTFGDVCTSNTFGNNCSSNAFGNNCSSNTFGLSYATNTFGKACSSNKFGNFCSSNTFGNNCSSNAFGDACASNTFGKACSSNKFRNYCSANTFGTGCSFIDMSAGTSPQQKKNYHVFDGVRGSDSSHISINGTNGNDFVTYVGMNSSGVLKMWIPADLAQ